MDFRRGHRDERRRRVLIDEPDVHEGEASSSKRATEAASSAEPARRYTEAALSPRQPRVIDLIPTRRWTNLVLFMLLLCAAIGILVLYSYVALGHTALRISQLPAINLAVRGSVATWFSSAMLAACAAYGLLTYQIRRHRSDDYRGRYRMWCWVIPMFLLASVDQVAGLQESVRAALLHVSQVPDYPDAMLVWRGSIALITGAIGARLMIEMRACRLAIMLLLVSLSCLAAVGAVQMDWLLAEAGELLRTMAVSGLTMGAHIGVLMAIFLYGRHVHHDARGGVPAKASRKRRRPKKAGNRDVAEEPQAASKTRRSTTRRKAGSVTRTDPPHTPVSSRKAAAAEEEAKASARPARKQKRRVAAEASAAEEPSSSTPCELDNDQVEQSRKMSKSERKRLRKQRRRERQP